MDNPPSHEDREPVRVLLVDDVQALRHLYRRVLEDHGPFEVVAEAGDGREAIDRAGQHTPDLVLLDISMPGMDGLEALPRIRNAAPDSNVVVLSGFLESRIGDQARERGAAAYLEKGDDPTTLVHRLMDAMDEPWLNGSAKPASQRTGPEPATPSDEELETFAYAASHDLQEPLRMVRSYLDLLEQACCGTQAPEVQELFEHARAGTERMQAMIDGLLSYSRVSTRAGPLEAVDLDAVLDEAIENLALTLEGSHAEITREALPRVPGDRGQLIQLFQNLVKNAVKFHEDEATIHVAAREEGQAWVITVTDDGPGIPEEEQNSVFSLLARGSSASGTQGQGMGLAICRRVVERHGGRIWLRSAPGEGTTVGFQLSKEPPETTDDARGDA